MWPLAGAHASGHLEQLLRELLPDLLVWAVGSRKGHPTGGDYDPIIRLAPRDGSGERPLQPFRAP